MVDGGSSGLGPEIHWDLKFDVGGWRDADAWPYEGGQPAEAQPDVGLEAGREAGSETGPDMSREIGSQVGRDAGGTACVPTSREALVLHALHGRATGGGLAVYGDRVFAGTTVDSPSGDPTGGEVFSMSMSTGISTTFKLDGSFPTMLVAQRDALFYIQCTNVPIGVKAWRADCTNVVSMDLQTGMASKLDNPPEYSSPGIESLVGNNKGELYWAIHDDWTSSVGLVRWDPMSRSATTLLQRKRASALVADDESLYWQEPDASSHVLFLSTPMVGGTVAQLYQSPAAIPDTTTLEAVDDRSIYYSNSHDIAAGIMAMPKGGGQSMTVVPNVDLFVDLGHAIDDTYVYWVDYAKQDTLRRTLKTDSTQTETIWSGPGWVKGVLVDACNIYWIVESPSAILVRAK
jgi:hypothetical protein